MKKGWIVPAVIVVVALLLFGWFKSAYNGMVQRSEVVSEQLGNVESQYQRRADLVPNLVATVKGYATHEQQTLTDVIEARAQATQTTLDVDDAASMAQYQAAQGQLSSALSRLLVSVEQYPDLKANQNFLDLQTQLEGTENRIAVERRRFNEVARDYNTFVRSFPRNMFAGMFGFAPKSYFEAAEGAEEAPQVQF